MTADIGQQQWSCKFFRLSDRTLISRVRNFVIWQKSVEFQAEARLLVAAWIWAISWHGGPVQTARTVRERAAHKSRRPEPSSHLETTCKIHHIYEDLNVLISQTREKSAVGDSAEPKQKAGRLLFFSSSASFSTNAGFSPGAGISTSARILSSAWFSLAARISQSAWFSLAARISQSAWFSVNAGISQSAWISVNAGISQSACFSLTARILPSAWFLLTASICTYFQYFIFCILY